MKNQGLFSTLFIEGIREKTELDDMGEGRMATLTHAWQACNRDSADDLWESFVKQAVSYLEFGSSPTPAIPGIYPLYEDWGLMNCISVLCLVDPKGDMDDTHVGHFWVGKLIAELKTRSLNWGILTDGSCWRLYSLKTAKPYEEYVELSLSDAIENNDEVEYALFEHFFHRNVFVPEPPDEEGDDAEDEKATVKGLYKCRLDRDGEQSEEILEEYVKDPLLNQVDEVLQYICNGFIADTSRKGGEYTEDERREIFESAVKLLYRCLFLFYAESRHLLPSDTEKTSVYKEGLSIYALCREAHDFRWGKRSDYREYDLWQHLKGLVSAVNDGDSEYGIMGYDGGLFDDEEEIFLGQHRLRNDFLARALYLLAFVEPYNSNPEEEYEIPYEDLEVRHLGELYENILEFNVMLAEVDMVRVQSKKGTQILPSTEEKQGASSRLIKKGEVYFGKTALERKQTSSYYTPEPLVHFLNQKSIIQPLKERFESDFRERFDQFLEQAIEGFDSSTQSGAVQSAVALIERFVNEVVLDFKVCDPAMGSGHFLVNASNQMTDLVVDLFTEIPVAEGFNSDLNCEANYWRRLITRHCLYGVDLNPLAVHLARLSLWLNSFARDHKLTFLDHHLRCGNSLIGVRSLSQLQKIPKRKKDRRRKTDQEELFDLDEQSNTLNNAATALQRITEVDEDDTDTQKSIYGDARDATSDLRPLADLYTAYLMDPDIQATDYMDLFDCLSTGKSISEMLNPYLPGLLKSVETYCKTHQFYHWPLEFTDVFGPGIEAGFSATIGNPPWDIVKTNSQEFFSDYDVNFRSYSKPKANKVADELMARNPQIGVKWASYCDSFESLGKYFREPEAYGYVGKGHLNIFKLFLEQFYVLLHDDGRMGIVVPSGIYTDQGCMSLRELFFNQSQIDFLYCFENRWPTVFSAVHNSFKFVTFGTKKGGKTDRFKCAFMEHDPERLSVIDDNALFMTLSNVERFSPDSLSVMEFQNQEEIDIGATLYGQHPFLGEYLKERWIAAFQDEFNITHDSDLFYKKDGIPDTELVPLWEGKQIWILTNGFSEPTNWMRPEDALIKLTTSQTRLTYRAIAANTNERTFIPTVIPAAYPTGNSLDVCPLPPQIAVKLSAILGSFALDWIMRNKVTGNVNKFIVKQLPIVDIKSDCALIQEVSEALLARASRLVCTTGHFSAIWESCFSENWIIPDFWYPDGGMADYGPAHEHAIRNEIYESARKLESKWSKECGVHKSSSIQVEDGTRAQLRAEIDAYVALLYGLSRENFGVTPLRWRD